MKKNRLYKILIIMVMLFTLTGCTKTLTNKNKEIVKNPATGQSLTQNILCQPTDKETIDIYNKYKKKIDIEKLPKCEEFKVTSGGYEGLWDSIFVKPLAFIILYIGKFVKSYGLALIITSLLIRLIAYPITKKTAIQSELIKKAQPELTRIENKYKDKTDQDSMMKKSQEMAMIYKKHNINPLAGCLYSFIQLPLFFAFLEAINRIPAIFEDKFLYLQMGTTPIIALQHGYWWYLILVAIIGATTYFSFVLNSTTSSEEMKSMPKVMTVMIIVMSLFMPAALGIYWFTTNLFTIGQNLLVKRSKALNENK